MTYALCQGTVYMGHKDNFPMQQNTDRMSQKWVGL